MQEHSSDYMPLVPEAPAIRFIADCMLGKLAKWLKILGYDTRYDRAATDEEIVRLSALEDRVILTRDTRLVQRRGARRFLLIESPSPPEQLRQVVTSLGLTLEERRILSRCLPCNHPLERVERDGVESQVPPFVFQTQRTFARCPLCRKIYWGATHRADIVRRIERLLGGGGGSAPGAPGGTLAPD